MRKFFTLLVISQIVFVCAKAQQNATVRGFVYDKDNGEPMPFSTVYLKGTNNATQTDVNGYFSLSKIKPGNYTINASSVGFDTATQSIILKEEQIFTVKLYLNKTTVNLKSVDILGKKEEQLTNVRISVETVTPKKINQLVSVGGQADIAQYLQVLPGVVFTGDQGGQLYIRGGSPIQNKVLLDGMIIYNPFHSIGLFSIFETDIIRNADVYTGGFNAEHGGRISAVMDVTTRDGNTKRLAGKISSSPFMSKILLEGPLGKSKNGNAPTFIFTYKRSYLEQTSKLFYPYAADFTNNATNGLPFNFSDLYGKVSFKSNTGSKLNLFGFNFNDQVNFNNINNIKWVSNGAGGNFILVPEGSSTMVKGNFAYSNYNINQVEADGLPRSSAISGFNTGLSFNYFLGKDEFVYGFDAIGLRTDFNVFNALGRRVRQEQNSTELDAYAKYKKVTNKLVIEPGLHMHWYAALAELTLEPRFGIKYNAKPGLRFKAAGGAYSQNLISAVSDRDIVNLFYGFLTGPDNLPATFNGKPVTSRLQRSQHFILGSEIDITKNIEINAEVYYKNFSQLTNINRDKLFDDNSANAARPDFQKKDFIIENGSARGFDFRIKYEKKRMYIWATYSLTYVTRNDSIRTYFPNFDRRHNVNFVSNYTFGKNNNWELGLRWNLGSGFPFTQTQGFYEQLNLNNVFSNVNNGNGQLGIAYAGINQGRLPYYHRLDASVKHTITLSQKQTLELNLSATNMYNRQNIFYFDRVRYTRVNQLPILPSLSVTWNF